jgi:hypothetical protein
VNQSRVELFGEVLLYLDTLASDSEPSDSEEMREVGEYVRNVLMPFVEQEQGWAMLSEGVPADWQTNALSSTGRAL